LLCFNSQECGCQATHPNQEAVTSHTSAASPGYCYHLSRRCSWFREEAHHEFDLGRFVPLKPFKLAVPMGALIANWLHVLFPAIIFRRRGSPDSVPGRPFSIHALSPKASYYICGTQLCGLHVLSYACSRIFLYFRDEKQCNFDVQTLALHHWMCTILNYAVVEGAAEAKRLKIFWGPTWRLTPGSRRIPPRALVSLHRAWRCECLLQGGER